MRDQVNHYLDRARMAAGVAVIGRVTQVDGRRRAARARAGAHPRRAKVQIAADCQPGIRFQGERQDFEEMLGNLLDNACKWARQKVFLKVEQAAWQRGQRRQLVVTVEDDGPGLTAEQMARIGKRGCVSMRRSPARGWGSPSSPTSSTPIAAGSISRPRRTGGLLVRLELPAA